MNLKKTIMLSVLFSCTALLAIAIALVLMLMSGMFEYWTIAKYKTNDGVVVKIYAETYWDISQAYYYDVKKGDNQLVPRTHWGSSGHNETTGEPDDGRKHFFVAVDKKGKLIGVMKVSYEGGKSFPIICDFENNYYMPGNETRGPEKWEKECIERLSEAVDNGTAIITPF